MDANPVVAIIPARGGSKRVPGKNVLPVAGKPLLAHTIEHALAAAEVHLVCVSTDDDAIADVARRCGARVVRRPPELATDTASSEAALRHALSVLRGEGVEPSLVVFLQATSPVRAPDDVDRAVRRLREEGADSLLSATRSARFLWSTREGAPRPLNYDPARRPRSQEMGAQFMENGSIYAFKPWVLDETGSRLGGRIAVHEMDFWSSFEIDDPDDVALVEWILARRAPGARRRPPSPVALLALDFDGVITDNGVHVDEAGREQVRCDRSDGLGVARLREAGVPMLVLSTETNGVVAARCRKLGVECMQGLPDKAGALRRVLDERKIDPAGVVYVGNDVNDLGCMDLAGFVAVPSDAHEDVRGRADLVLRHAGGRGAVRELSDLILNHWRPTV